MTTPSTIRRIWAACGVAGVAVLVLAAVLVAQRWTAGPPVQQTGEPGLGLPVTVQVGASPKNVAVTPDGRRILVTAQPGLTVLDAGTRTVLGTIANEYGFNELLVAPDGERAYTRTSAGIVTVDLLAGLIGDPVTGHADPITAQAEGIPYQLDAISPDGTRLFGAITDTGGDALGVVDLVAGTPRRITLPKGAASAGVAVTADGTRAYVVDRGASGITSPLQVVDLATGAATAVPGTEGTLSVALSPDGRFLHASGYSKALVLDPVTGSVMRESAASLEQAGRLVPLPGGRYHLAVDQVRGDVRLVDVEAGRTVANVPTGGSFPRDVALAPDAGALYVVTDTGLAVVPITGA